MIRLRLEKLLRLNRRQPTMEQINKGATYHHSLSNVLEGLIIRRSHRTKMTDSPGRSPKIKIPSLAKEMNIDTKL